MASNSDSVQWNWKYGFCKKHVAQYVPCRVCIETLDGDLVREKPIAEAKAAFLAGLGWTGTLTAAETQILEIWRETQIQPRKHQIGTTAVIIEGGIPAIKSEDTEYFINPNSTYAKALIANTGISPNPRVTPEEWVASEDIAYKSASFLGHAVCCQAIEYNPNVRMDVLMRAAFFFERDRNLSAPLYAKLGIVAERAILFVKASLRPYLYRVIIKDGVADYVGIQSVTYNLDTHKITVKETEFQEPKFTNNILGGIFTNRVEDGKILLQDVKISPKYRSRPFEFPFSYKVPQSNVITENEWVGLEERAFASFTQKDRDAIRATINEFPEATINFLARYAFCFIQGRGISTEISRRWTPERWKASHILSERLR